MNNKKTTRRALFSSIMALLLCCSMLLGTTFAWFTDSVTSAGNIIKSGTLDVTMEWKDATTTGKQTTYKDASTGPIFNYDLWEPGYVEAKNIKISNIGTLALKYQLNILATGEVSKLTDVIDVYFAEGEKTLADRNMTELTKLGTLTQILAGMPANTSGDLKAQETDTVTIALKMQEGATNEYQNLSVGADFCVQLLATQLEAESDSFGPEYDEGSQWLVSGAGFAAANGTDDVKVVVTDVNTGEPVAVLTVPGVRTVAETNVSAHVEEERSVDEAVWSVATQGGETKSFDIHVDGLADGTEPVAVELFIGEGLESPKLYHGTGDPIMYTEVTPVSYKASTGFITFETANFSPFVVVYEKKDVSAGTIDTWDGTADISWYNETDTEFVLTSAESLAGFRALVDGGNTFEGKTVKLDANVDLYLEGTDGEPVSFDPIGYGYDVVFKGTFDGQGHTISNLYQNGWALGYDYSTEAGGLFASVVDATIKDLTIDGAEIVMECIDMGTLVGYSYGNCTYENIKISNSTIANYQRYTGGVVGEVNGTQTFKNVDVDDSCTVSSLWGDFDCSLGGIVGGKYGQAGLTFEDCDVACVINAYNDVTSSYQWYAYRRAGMLIGNSEETEKVGDRTSATASYLTATNCTVTYGDWANYTYCEFAGTSWPYVRVQAGYSCDAYSNPRYGVATDANGNKAVDDTHVHNDGEDHNILLAFDQLFGGGQGIYGTATHDGVTVIYNNK